MAGSRLSRYFALLLLVGVLASVGLVSGVAFAQGPPGLPMVVSGSVTLNGTPAPDGQNLTAWDGGQFVGSTSTSYNATVGMTNYTLEVCGSAGQTCTAGDTISFELDGLTTSQTTTFCSAITPSCAAGVTLNLAFTGTIPAAASVSTAVTTSTPVPEYGSTVLVLLVAVGIVALASSLVARRRGGP